MPIDARIPLSTEVPDLATLVVRAEQAKNLQTRTRQGEFGLEQAQREAPFRQADLELQDQAKAVNMMASFITMEDDGPPSVNSDGIINFLESRIAVFENVGKGDHADDERQMLQAFRSGDQDLINKVATGIYQTAANLQARNPQASADARLSARDTVFGEVTIGGETVPASATTIFDPTTGQTRLDVVGPDGEALSPGIAKTFKRVGSTGVGAEEMMELRERLAREKAVIEAGGDQDKKLRTTAAQHIVNFSDEVGTHVRQQHSLARSANIVLNGIRNAFSNAGIDITTAGLGGAILSNLPGTARIALQAELETVRANIAFKRLNQMRTEESVTGGALGQVSNFEIDLLMAAYGALDPNSEPEALGRQLSNLRVAFQGVRSIGDFKARQISRMHQMHAEGVFGGRNVPADQKFARMQQWALDNVVNPAREMREYYEMQQDIANHPNRKLRKDPYTAEPPANKWQEIRDSGNANNILLAARVYGTVPDDLLHKLPPAAQLVYGGDVSLIPIDLGMQ